jgi:hypothetical protein
MMENLLVTVDLCQCSLRKCSGITLSFTYFRILGFRLAIAHVRDDESFLQ